MSLKIERMNIVNQRRGKILFLARFDVNFGPMTVKGYELVKWDDGNVNVSEPYNLFTPRGENKPKRFTYVFYNGDRGKKMQEQIIEMAKEEYKRRNSAPKEEEEFFGGGGRQSDNLFDDDIPF